MAASIPTSLCQHTLLNPSQGCIEKKGGGGSLEEIAMQDYAAGVTVTCDGTPVKEGGCDERYRFKSYALSSKNIHFYLECLQSAGREMA